jgi:hypothetical protein
VLVTDIEVGNYAEEPLLFSCLICSAAMTSVGRPVTSVTSAPTLRVMFGMMND